MQIPKSYWFYWHTGNKPVAVTSMIVNAAVLGLVFALSVGFSVWGIILAVLLDSLGLLLVVAYFFLRDHLPGFMLENGDTFMLQQFIIPVCIALVSGRLITFLVSRLEPQWFKRGAVALVGMMLVSGVVVLKINYDQQKALEAAAAQPGHIEKLKVSVAQFTDNAVDGAKQKFSDTCKRLADSLGKTPDDYCK